MQPVGLRIVLDQGVPRDTAVLLREDGADCTHVAELGMSRAGDPEILAWALEHDAVLVTLDADFHAQIAVSAATKPSVIRIRLQGLDGVDVARLVQRLIAEFESALARGCLLTVKRRKTTCHRLPIGS